MLTPTSERPMHTPTMTPVVYEAGFDLKLMEFRGWDLAAMQRRGYHITVQRFGPDKWYVMDGECNGLRRPEGDDKPISFVFGLRDASPFPSAEDALSCLTAYLNQPINPYVWIRDNADPE